MTTPSRLKALEKVAQAANKYVSLRLKGYGYEHQISQTNAWQQLQADLDALSATPAEPDGIEEAAKIEGALIFRDKAASMHEKGETDELIGAWARSRTIENLASIVSQRRAGKPCPECGGLKYYVGHINAGGGINACPKCGGSGKAESGRES